MKYVLVTGGVVSGLGKGITSSSIGLLLKHAGLRVTSVKIDPYLNSDAGTMSPYEHGEVFVLDDGGEADLDLGNYERFLDVTLTRNHNITTGKIYSKVIAKEREGGYLGKTVQVVPHITDEIQRSLEEVSKIPVDGSKQVPEVCMIELGGTVGDIESMVFLESLRQFRYTVGADNFCHVHVSLVPVVGAVGEPKSKPTQHGVRELRAAGLSPDIIVCRSTAPLPITVLNKISLFCMVPATHIMCIHDVSNIYRVPLLMLQQRVPETILGCLKLNRMPPHDLPTWRQFAETVDDKLPEVRIGIVGKYTGLSDSYLSVSKALQHAAIAIRVALVIDWIESGNLEEGDNPENKAWQKLRSVHGILVPGGFGDRGVQGKVLAIQYARENKIPFFGICLGMQMAVIEFARNILSLDNANSSEFDEKTPHPVVIYMPEISKTQMGGTMRLGIRATHIAEGSLAEKLYGQKVINERHRHRYEVNPKYVPAFTKAGFVFSGKDDQKDRMEITELPDHPFFIGVQYHPEFLSRPTRPSPVFLGFVKASAHADVNDSKRPLTDVKATNGSKKARKKTSRTRSSREDTLTNGTTEHEKPKDSAKGKGRKGKRKGGKKAEGKQEKKRKS